jgi:hypothetical protein
MKKRLNLLLTLLFICYTLIMFGLFIKGFYPEPPNIKKLDAVKLIQFKNSLNSSNLNVEALDGELRFNTTIKIDMQIGPDTSEETIMKIFNEAVPIINNDKYYNHNTYIQLSILGIKDCFYIFNSEKNGSIFNKWLLRKIQIANDKEMVSESEITT